MATHSSIPAWEIPWIKESVTNHNLGGLKQQKYILPQFWRPKSKMKVLAESHLLWEL